MEYVAIIIAFAAFISSIWQIARTEGMKDPETGGAKVGRPVQFSDGTSTVWVSFNFDFRDEQHNRELAVWGSAELLDEEQKETDPKTLLEGLAADEDIKATVRWERGDKDAYVAVIWHRTS